MVSKFFWKISPLFGGTDLTWRTYISSNLSPQELWRIWTCHRSWEGISLRKRNGLQRSIFQFGCCLNPKLAGVFRHLFDIYLAPRKEDPGMYTYIYIHGFHYPVPHSNPFARIIWMCFHGSMLVAQRFLEINFQMMFLVQHVSYSVLWITFKFSMWCFQAMKKYVIYCN